MNRLHRVGMVLSIALVLVAISIPATGRAVSPDALAKLRGGDLVYCATRVTAGPGCTGCYPVRMCMLLLADGSPSYQMTFLQCMDGHTAIQCHATSWGSMPSTPTCDRLVRGAACGINSYVSTDGCVANMVPWLIATSMCGDVSDYLCSRLYDDSAVGPYAQVNCSNMPTGDY